MIIFPRVLVLSRCMARFRWAVRTWSRVVRYSRANSLMIRQKLVTLTSLTEKEGWPRNSRKEWNLQQEEQEVLRVCAPPRSAARVLGVLPVDDPPVDDLQDADPLGGVFQELRHLAVQHGLGLMFGHQLQVVP